MKTPYDEGFSAGQSDLEADLLSLLDEFGLEHLAQEEHPITVLRGLLRKADEAGVLK